MNKILLNEKVFTFGIRDLPFLIHGEEHTGSSLFTMTLLANLYFRDPKVLMLSGYFQARDEFINQTDDEDEAILADKNHNIGDLENKNIIFVKREDFQFFTELSKNLGDIEERIILVKNIDLFPEEVFEAVKDKKMLIISGDINKCAYREKILAKDFKTKVVFSKPQFDIGFETPGLNKYEGYLSSSEVDGKVTLKIVS